MKYLFNLLALLSISVLSFAQNSEPEMADVLRSNGKIYVVVTVLCIIFLGIFIYLFSIDRKVSRLEKLTQNVKQD